ncbi:MAG: hypothetical protein WC373_12205 [Smithella sp.]|jgi:hypothetical protein
MADTVFESITKNIITTLSGLSLSYGGETKTLSCDRERYIDVIGDRTPLAIICGPNIEVMSRAHLVTHCELVYQIMVIDTSVNDEYDSDVVIAPITEVMANIPGDIIKQLMTDRTRGGYAQNTEFDACGYYFDSDGKIPMFISYVLLTVKAFVRDTDVYSTGG